MATYKDHIRIIYEAYIFYIQRSYNIHVWKIYHKFTYMVIYREHIWSIYEFISNRYYSYMDHIWFTYRAYIINLHIWPHIVITYEWYMKNVYFIYIDHIWLIYGAYIINLHIWSCIESTYNLYMISYAANMSHAWITYGSHTRHTLKIFIYSHL